LLTALFSSYAVFDLWKGGRLELVFWTVLLLIGWAAVIFIIATTLRAPPQVLLLK
jgi:hypothetical protein